MKYFLSARRGGQLTERHFQDIEGIIGRPIERRNYKRFFIDLSGSEEFVSSLKSYCRGENLRCEENKQRRYLA